MFPTSTFQKKSNYDISLFLKQGGKMGSRADSEGGGPILNDLQACSFLSN